MRRSETAATNIMKRKKITSRSTRSSKSSVPAKLRPQPPSQFRVAAPRTSKSKRKLDVHPDPLDFRDRMFEPTLVEVPPGRLFRAIGNYSVPILDQGQEGACTGFGLATVVNYLLNSFRDASFRDHAPVSPRMLYDMARRYDEWPGENYEGSSARGAMKGWHKHGVCSETLWPYKVSASEGRSHRRAKRRCAPSSSRRVFSRESSRSRRDAQRDLRSRRALCDRTGPFGLGQSRQLTDLFL